MPQAPGGGCLAIHGAGYPGGAGGLLLAECNSSDASQAFTYDAAAKQLAQSPRSNGVDVHNNGPLVWMYGCSTGANDMLSLDDGAAKFEQKGSASASRHGPGGRHVRRARRRGQAARELGGGAFVNPDAKPRTIRVLLSALPLTGGGATLTSGGPLQVRDVWAKADRAPLARAPRRSQ